MFYHPCGVRHPALANASENTIWWRWCQHSHNEWQHANSVELTEYLFLKKMDQVTITQYLAVCWLAAEEVSFCVAISMPRVKFDCISDLPTSPLRIEFVCGAFTNFFHTYYIVKDIYSISISCYFMQVYHMICFFLHFSYILTKSSKIFVSKPKSGPSLSTSLES